ncbi:ABC transporter ATP-binding protein [Thalassospira sp. UBA1131]|uniref:ABC transporter ATP-binding protein n=1 Tax=Thalassospira sp. UBA1131 TaxID=1947672 RepID=UPI0025D3B895|nr:ABC transporter ATP-binding protein [Thalassospira sp. UBA1131]
MPKISSTLMHRLWLHLSSTRKTQIIFVLLLSIATSVLEIASISSLLPLLSALIDPRQLIKLPVIGDFLERFSNSELLFFTSFIFCLLAVLSGVARFSLTVIQSRLSYSIGSDIALGIYLRVIRRPLIEQLKSNSSDVISAISVKTEIVVRQFLFPVLTIVSASVLSLAIVVLLFLASPAVTLVSLLSFGVLYLGVYLFTRGALRRSGETIDVETGGIIKKVQQGLGAVRDIILDSNHELYEREFVVSDRSLRRARANIQIISDVPRYVIEAGGLVFFGILAYVLSSQGILTESLPGLGVLALGIQRLLPTLQLAYAAWACIQGAQRAVVSTLEFMDLELPREDRATKPMLFNRSIEVKALYFSYGEDHNSILKGIDLHISRGARIGVVGKTGSGKSTLLDILMGLLVPTDGAICVDGVEVDFHEPSGWHRLVAHVPQTIFIADASIGENIALGIEPNMIDEERVRWCLEKSQLSEFVDQLPKGLDTVVGEHGAWLSGGQRQRIGIARALYKSARFIVLDEATSALDESTEAEVMQSIESLGDDITIVMVAHKLNSLRYCDKIVELRDGEIYRVGSFQEFAKYSNLESGRV